MLNSLRKLDTIPTKGFVKKFTIKMTIASVTVRGSKITSPVIKYFFMKVPCLCLDDRKRGVYSASVLE